MNITPADRDNKYRSSSEKIRDLYASMDVTRKINAIFSKYNLPRTLHDNFTHISGDIILGFYTLADIPKLVAEGLKLDASTAKSLGGDLLNTLLAFGVGKRPESLPSTPPQQPPVIKPAIASAPQQKPGAAPQQARPAPAPIPQYRKPLVTMPQYNTNPSPSQPAAPKTPPPPQTPRPPAP